ncbi:hypothetical protein LX32DRAFT_634032 [Colletotrichum zoysiae]|uniref:Uncharacterized protein n=1 Tax=Colletotrichum zoysiae TaxID=1216348 RepID=A0AAD9M936_9PEZI|nr:hypothetical protein LX32DRAFT_634032 [Colletotrichum zoysiae]
MVIVSNQTRRDRRVRATSLLFLFLLLLFVLVLLLLLRPPAAGFFKRSDQRPAFATGKGARRLLPVQQVVVAVVVVDSLAPCSLLVARDPFSSPSTPHAPAIPCEQNT